LNVASSGTSFSNAETANVVLGTDVQKLLLRHLLDPMHCEKNIIENIVKYFFGASNSYGSRQDMTSLGIRHKLWLQASRNNREAFHVPEAPYVLKASERKLVIEVIRSIKTHYNKNKQM
jgi:hypothetical protein